MKQHRGPIIAGGAGVLVVLLLIMVMIMPKVSKIHETNDQLATAQAQEQSLQTQLTSLKATANQAAEIRTQLHLLDAAVPEQADLPDLIRMLNDTADQAGVDFMSVAPAAPEAVAGGVQAAPALPSGATGETPSPNTGESAAPAPVVPTGPTLPESISLIPVSITINGTYFAIDEYLFRLESLPRISKVTQIAISAGAGGYPELSLTFSVNYYTTDASAGPGSAPGHQDSGVAGSVTYPSAAPQESPSPSPPASPAG